MQIKIPSLLRNKYIIALLLVLAWVAFFDKNNLIYQYRLKNQLKELKSNKNYFLEEIRKDSTAIDELRNNPEALEKFAREKYLMKKTGEDIFIIIED
jgi:cell division protein DivIC